MLDSVEPGNGLARFQGLARREITWFWRFAICGSAEHEYLQSGFPVTWTQTHVVRRALVSKITIGREGIVMLEISLVVKYALQNPGCGRRLDASMELGWQISRCYVYFCILRIRARRNGCSVCNPHAGGRAACTQQPWRRRRRQVNDVRIITGKTQLPEHIDRGTILRRQYALPDSQVGKM